MSRKRQEAAKERYRRARDAGFSPKEAAKMRYWSDKRVNQAIRNRKRSQEAAERYRRAREAGFSAKEAAKMRYWSRSRFENELVRKRNEDKYITIYWRDKLEDADPDELIHEIKNAYKYVSNEYLILSIIGFLQIKEGYIGQIEIRVTKGKEKPMMDMLYFDWGELYHGKADPRRYHELLVAINAGVQLLYEQSEKADFVYRLIATIQQINPETAQRLQRDLNIHSPRGMK